MNQLMPDRQGQITRTYFIDDDRNVSKKYVEYDVLVVADKGTMAELKNVRAMVGLSGLNDYEYKILEDNQVALKGKLDASNPPQNMNGTWVIVGFLNGNYFQPYIKGSFDHPGLAGSATKEKGIHRFKTFRGFNETLNKDGELILGFSGTKNPEGKPTDEKAVPVTFKIGKTDKIEVEGGHSLILFAGGLKLTMKDGTSLVINSEDSSFSLLQKDGHKVEVTASGIKAQDKDGANVEITGGGIKVLDADGASVEVTGGNVTAKDSSGGTLKLSGGKVGLGGSSAELVDIVSQLLTKLSTTTAPGFGAPISTVADFAALQAQVDAIKGGI